MEVTRKSITYFEDLSNEILYEIFDLLDFCQVYDVFCNLNKRFQNLFIHSSLPIDVNLSFIFKSTFQRYYKQIIIPNQHRIKSLQLNNPFITHSIFSLSNTELKLNRLEKLILHNIGSKYPDNLFNYLASLPYLFSLTITFEHPIRKKSILYDELFRLPVLKYCQVSLNGIEQYEELPYATNRFSPIETFITKDSCTLVEFHILLSYLPQLRRLSVPFVFGIDYENSFMLEHLRHLTVDRGTHFESLEMMIQDLFPQLQILYVFTIQDREYFDANRWKRLITNHMPYLQVFDIQLSYSLRSSENITDYMVKIGEFQSSFWFERHWFFEHHISHNGYRYHINLFSTNPYRRHKYTLYDEQNKSISENISIDSVRHFKIENELETVHCMKYFPNVTELTISCHRTKKDEYFLLTTLKDLIPLRQLTKLTIEDYYGCFSKVIELIQCTPNLTTLSMNTVSLGEINLSLNGQHELYRSVFETNNVKEMNITWPSTLEEIRYLIKLFPRLQCLTIYEPADYLDFILSRLLTRHNVNTPESFLNTEVMLQMISNIVRTMFEPENPRDDYLTEIIKEETLMIYIWR